MTYPEQNLAHVAAELEPSLKHITPAMCTASGASCVQQGREGGSWMWVALCHISFTLFYQNGYSGVTSSPASGLNQHAL